MRLFLQISSPLSPRLLGSRKKSRKMQKMLLIKRKRRN
jgi:hypothetical protein